MRVGRPTAVLLVSACLVAAAFFATPSAARNLANAFRTSGEEATPDQVNDVVGEVSYEAQCSAADIGTNSLAWKGRTVKVTLGKTGTGWREPPILRALLNGAIGAAQTQCPMTMPGEDPIPEEDVGAAYIYASPAAGQAAVEVARAKEYMRLYGYWAEVEDLLADQEAAAQQPAQAIGEQQGEAAQQGASDATQQQNASMQATQQTEAQATEQRTRESRQSWLAFWFTVRLLFGLSLLWSATVWVVKNWETLIRWYYQLTPHPAADMVHAAVSAGVALDGETFSEILRPIPGGRIEREVRAKQAAELAAMARRGAEELERRAEELRREIRERAAYQAAQRDLHDSTIEQQLAAMRAEALAKVDAFLNRSRRA